LAAVDAENILEVDAADTVDAVFSQTHCSAVWLHSWPSKKCSLLDIKCSK